MTTLAEGITVRERYTIIKRIGEGGMGAVFKARDANLHTFVALKQTLISNPQHSQILEREARLLASLRHPGIPQVREHFAIDDAHFLVMEFIEGDNLNALLQKNRGSFAEMQVLEWAHDLMDTLEYLHTRTPPVIHRDIKPANIISPPDGRLILIDFGLARDTAGGRSLMAYTPAFAPPEQILGQGTDQQSDIYSLAATCYNLLTNRVPVNAADRLAATTSGSLDPLIPPQQLNPAISPAFNAAIMEAMQLDRKQRTASVAAVRANLQPMFAVQQTELPAFALPAERREPVQPQAKRDAVPTTFAGHPAAQRRWLPLAIIAAVLLLLGGGGAWFALGGTATQSDAPPATSAPAAVALEIDEPTASPIVEQAAPDTSATMGALPIAGADEQQGLNEPPRFMDSATPDTLEEPTATSIPASTATPIPPSPTPDLRARFPSTQVQQILNTTGGTYSVVVDDLNSPEAPVFFANDLQIMTAASLIKLPIALAAYRLAADGAVNLEQQVILTAADIVGGTGSLQYEPPGSTYTLRALIARMIAESDNTAANIVIREIGGLERINAVLATEGLSRTIAGRLLMDFEAAAQGRENRTSAADIAAILQLVYNSAIPGANEILLAMQQHTDRQKIPALLPAEAVLGNKTGVLPVGISGGAEHDAAIIQMPDGRAYSVVIMTEGIVDNQTTINAISQAGRVIYDSLLQP